MNYPSPIKLDQLQVQRDPLTGLFQQNYLLSTLEETLKKSRHQAVSATLALFQLENFYEIRAWLGKSEANLLLSDIARVMEKYLPKSVLLCRCHNYEFAAVMFDECSVNARQISDRIKQGLQAAVRGSLPPQLELKCGVGFAEVESQIPSTDVLFARARHSLSLAHYRGDSSHHFHRQGALAPTTALPRVKRVLQENRLRLSFQPLVSFKEDGIQHYEIRCFLPPLGTQEQSSLPAAMLFETASRNAFGEAIDRWVIGQALALLGQHPQDGLRLTLSLTLNSLVSANFLKWLESKSGRDKLSLRRLVFQINEIDVLFAQHHMGQFCDKLNQLNIKLTVSNFGCTEDPFRYLPILRAHFVKLDVSLLEKIARDPDKYQQLEHTVELLHKQGLRVIAGMIEEMTLLPLLWKAKVNFVQGYCFQKPATSTNFEFLREETLEL